MNDYIVKQRISDQPSIPRRQGFFEQEVMKGEIEGIRISSVTVRKGGRMVIKTSENEIHLFLFIRSAGCIECGLTQFEFHEIAVFVPKLNSPFAVRSTHAEVGFLAIKMLLTEADRSFVEKNKVIYPYFRACSDCIPYREEIKSEKTTSRMFVPENIVPRISIGSVQTTGPDIVAAHEHPMLEQLLYGLDGNHCHVQANNHETLFEENTLLHIPLGSIHSVWVEEGYHLHYLWMDFFRNQEDMSYITKSHRLQDSL